MRKFLQALRDRATMARGAASHKVLVIGTAISVAVMAVPAFAGATPPTPSEIVGSGGQSLYDDLLSVAVVLVPLSVGLLLIPKAIRWVAKLIK